MELRDRDRAGEDDAEKGAAGGGPAGSGAPLVRTEGKKVYVGTEDKPGKLDEQRWELRKMMGCTESSWS